MGKIKNKKSETTNEINELELLKKKYEEQKIEIEYLKNCLPWFKREMRSNKRKSKGCKINWRQKIFF